MAQETNRSHDRLITCHDLTGHQQQLTVFPDRNRIILVTAAGETAVLTSHQVGQLRAEHVHIVLQFYT